MLCPLDQTQLIMADRHGVEIDYCPKCRGVWLDRGELDKIIERAAAASAERLSPPHRRRPDAPTAPDYSDYQGAGYQHHGTPYQERYQERRSKKKPKKRKGGFGDLLEDIFDF